MNPFVQDSHFQVRYQIWQCKNQSQLLDFTVECRGKIFCMHKLVILSQCPTLQRRNIDPKGVSKTNIIDLSIFTIETVQRLIDYLYLGEYAADQILPGSAKKRPDLQSHVDMFAAGVELQMPILQSYAVHEYSKTLLACSFQEFIRSIKHVYYTSSNEHCALRLVVLDYAQMRVIDSGLPPEKTVWITEMEQNCPEFVDDLKLSFKRR